MNKKFLHTFLDLNVHKTLAVTVRFFSQKAGKIVDQLLALKRVVHTRGEDLWLSVKEVAEDFGLDLRLCVGLATDGANNVAGKGCCNQLLS